MNSLVVKPLLDLPHFFLRPLSCLNFRIFLVFRKPCSENLCNPLGIEQRWILRFCSNTSMETRYEYLDGGHGPAGQQETVTLG